MLVRDEHLGPVPLGPGHIPDVPTNSHWSLLRLVLTRRRPGPDLLVAISTDSGRFGRDAAVTPKSRCQSPPNVHESRSVSGDPLSCHRVSPPKVRTLPTPRLFGGGNGLGE